MRPGTASAQFADLTGEREVLRGEPAGGGGDQVKRPLVPGDGDLRVVAGLLGQVADRVDVKQCVAEVRAGHRPGELPVRHVPAGSRAESRGDLLRGERVHDYGIPFLSALSIWKQRIRRHRGTQA